MTLYDKNEEKTALQKNIAYDNFLDFFLYFKINRHSSQTILNSRHVKRQNSLLEKDLKLVHLVLKFLFMIGSY